jgi:hypothetical protein
MKKPTLYPVPNEPGNFILKISNSSLELLTTCPRAGSHYLIQRRRLVSTSAALLYGGAVHAGLVPRKLRVPNWEAEQAKAVEQSYDGKAFPPDDWRTPDRCIAMLQGYNRAYPIDGEPFTVLPESVESKFEVRIGTVDFCDVLETADGPLHVNRLDIHYTGRIDAIVSWDGTNFIMDHKTTSVLGPTFWDDFQLSAQMIGYVWAARQLGYDVKGLLLDVIAGRKPTRTGTSAEYLRQRYWYPEEHVEEWLKDVFTQIQDWLEKWSNRYFPKCTKWCIGKYGRCQYFDVCTQKTTDERTAMLSSEAYEDVVEHD